jgi:hypothetical protein
MARAVYRIGRRGVGRQNRGADPLDPLLVIQRKLYLSSMMTEDLSSPSQLFQPGFASRAPALHK